MNNREIYQAQTLNIVVYGMGNSFLESEGYLLERVNIIGCSDSDEGRRESDLAKRYPFYSPQELAQIFYDYIFVVSIYDDEIRDRLIQAYGVQPARILTREEWGRLVFVKQGAGIRYPDQYVYVISKPIRVKSGLFSYVFTVADQLQYAEDMQAIPVVDMRSFPNIYLDQDKVGRENAWEYYFEPLSNLSVEEIADCKNILLGYDAPEYKTNYTEKYDIARLHRAYRKWIHMKPEVLEDINRECNEILPCGFEKVLGVLYRGTDMVSLKLKNHPAQPTLDEICELIEKYWEEWECEMIYLCTEDAAALEVFKKRFGEKIVYSSQLRFANTANRWLGEIFDEVQGTRRDRGAEYLKTIEILSRCDHMIASVCSGSVCAHVMHGDDYKHLLMIDKGQY